MSANVTQAYLLLPDLEAVAAAERAVAGMPLLLRTTCTLRDAGVERVVVVAPAGWPPPTTPDGPRPRSGGPGAPAATTDPGAPAATTDPGAPAATTNPGAPAATTNPGAPAATTNPGAATALVLRGDLVYQRDLVRQVVGATAGTVVVTTLADAPRCVACVAPAADAALLATRAAAVGLDDAVGSALGAPAPLTPAAGAVLPVRTTAEVKRAERELLGALRKPTDGIVARHVNRRVSLWVTSLLMRTRVRPNHVSVVTLLLGVLAGVAAATGGWAGGVAGALLLEAQSILDGVDGELARLKHQRSRLGEWLDTISDDLALQSFLVGLMVNLARAGTDWAVALGSVAIGAALAGRVVVYWLLATVYRSGNQLVITWDFTAARDARGLRRVGVWVMTGFRAVIKRDCFATLFVLLALVGRLDVVLTLASLGALGYLAKLVPQTQRLLRARRRARPTRRRAPRLAHVTAV